MAILLILFGASMSLFSTFYSGDAGVIENAAKTGSFELSRLTGIRSADFSGGLAQAFLFPEDFLALTRGGSRSFWTLKTKSLTDGEDQGFYRVPDVECERIVQLEDADLSAFSIEWNRRRAENAARIERSRSIWRSRPYWAITGGVSFGLLFGYAKNPSSVLLAIFLAWLALAVAFAGYITRRRLRTRRRILTTPVDWIARLRELQSFLRETRQNDLPVYYHWSL